MKNKLLILFLLFFISSCGSVSPVIEQPETWDIGDEGTYKIGVSDQLQVGVWKNPELSVAVPVRPDGKISVPLVGDVLAAGRTTEELSTEITHELSKLVFVTGHQGNLSQVQHDGNLPSLGFGFGLPLRSRHLN